MSDLRVMMDNHILPECFLDTNLMETLLPTKIGYNHQKCCTSVTKAMQSKKLIDDFAVGILDKDKKAPPYLNEFELVTVKYNVELYRHKLHPKKHHYLILHPVLEKWLLAECLQVNLSLEDYNLSNNIEELKKQSKPATSKDDYRFKSLFRALKENNAQGITLLFAWTDYLIKNPYKADKTILINIGNAS
ncbi:MAG: hypothetical protein Q8Q54_08395 [Methylococcales bacterium]|nr:hypothetical protein [Methylococcales bacterium]MDP3838924.1 hypothetical protein [Methylococcales bacterium]